MIKVEAILLNDHIVRGTLVSWNPNGTILLGRAVEWNKKSDVFRKFDEFYTIDVINETKECKFIRDCE